MMNNSNVLPYIMNSMFRNIDFLQHDEYDYFLLKNLVKTTNFNIPQMFLYVYYLLQFVSSNSLHFR